MYSISKKNSIKENFNQTIEEATPGFVSGAFIGIFSVIGILLLGWHKIFENIISENMALYTTFLFCAFVCILWGIYYLFCFFDMFYNLNKIFLNITRCFVNYTSLTLGINISVWTCLSLLSFFSLGDVSSIAMIKKSIYTCPRIIGLMVLCVMIFWPYHIHEFRRKIMRKSKYEFPYKRRNKDWYYVYAGLAFISVGLFFVFLLLCYQSRIS